MKTEEEIKQKIKEISFFIKNIIGIKHSEETSAFLRALLWVLEEQE